MWILCQGVSVLGVLCWVFLYFFSDEITYTTCLSDPWSGCEQEEHGYHVRMKDICRRNFLLLTNGKPLEQHICSQCAQKEKGQPRDNCEAMQKYQMCLYSFQASVQTRWRYDENTWSYNYDRFCNDYMDKYARRLRCGNRVNENQMVVYETDPDADHGSLDTPKRNDEKSNQYSRAEYGWPWNFLQYVLNTETYNNWQSKLGVVMFCVDFFVQAVIWLFLVYAVWVFFYCVCHVGSLCSQTPNPIPYPTPPHVIYGACFFFAVAFVCISVYALFSRGWNSLRQKGYLLVLLLCICLLFVYVAFNWFKQYSQPYRVRATVHKLTSIPNLKFKFPLLTVETTFELIYKWRRSDEFAKCTQDHKKLRLDIYLKAYIHIFTYNMVYTLQENGLAQLLPPAIHVEDVDMDYFANIVNAYADLLHADDRSKTLREHKTEILTEAVLSIIVVLVAFYDHPTPISSWCRTLVGNKGYDTDKLLPTSDDFEEEIWRILESFGEIKTRVYEIRKDVPRDGSITCNLVHILVGLTKIVRRDRLDALLYQMTK